MPLAGTRKVAEFSAETVEKAVQIGLRTLGVSADDVEIAVLQREQRKLGFLKTEAVISITYDEDYIRRKRDEAEIEKYLTLRFAPDGFALKVNPVPEELHWELLEVTTHFLIKHCVPGFRRLTREQLVEEQTGEYHVIFEPEVIELDGLRASMYLSPPKMDAYFIQYDVGRIKRETLMAAIAHKGVVRGLDEAAVESILNGTYMAGLPIVIAQGERPIDEKAAPLEYQFNPSSARITYKEDSSVDFRDVMRLSFVEQDSVLIRKGQRSAGTNGWTVTGEEIKFKVEAEKTFPAGKGTCVSDDGQELRAAMSGHIEMHDGLVSVEETFTVQGDVDYHVGNIEFDGSVIVAGDVLPEFEIRAKGNVEVFGTVDDAAIEAGGDVIVQYGIFSKGFGHVTAKGDVRARHCENVAISARRIYIATSAVNSTLTARDLIEVARNPGTLVGGVARAGKYVLANIFGSEIGTRTDVIVGDPSEYDARIDELRRLIGQKARRRMDLIRQHEVAKTAGAGMQGLISVNSEKLDQLLREAEQIDAELPGLRSKLRPVKEKRRRLAVAKCHVYTRLHESTLVRLFTTKRYFTESINHCTLLFDKDQVRAFPFQYSELDAETASDETPEDDEAAAPDENAAPADEAPTPAP
jgi:uncharacterized protein (DUF342 family)